MDYKSTIRARIGDKRREVVQKFTGNGTLDNFGIAEKNPFGFEITENDVLVPTDDYTYDADLKKIIFTTAPANESLVIIKYYSNAFTDAEIDLIYQQSGQDIDKATAEALRQALGDQARMVSFQHGDRSVSLSDIFKNLMSLLDSYEKKVSNSGANASEVRVGQREMNDRKIVTNPEDISRLFF